MRKYRLVPTLALMGALSVLACGEAGGDDQAAGYSEQQQGTAVNDTSPHRPGTPGTPGQQP